MGFASLYPSLYGALEVKRQASLQTPLSEVISVSWFDRGCFFVPTTISQSAARSRGQGWPALRWRHGGIVSRPRLEGGEPGARLDGRDDRSRDRRQDMILDWAANDACGKHRITLYPVRDESPGP